MTTTAKIKSFQPTTFHAWLAALGFLVAVGVAAMGYILIEGLSSTNLTDLVPWGLWITVDLSSIALSAGAFLFCAAVYLLGLKEFEPMARTAGYVGLIGYGMAMMCLLMDIGRPDRFWHGFVFWNIHSPLWEVTMCVGLYFTVLVLENLPNLGRWKWLQNKMPKIANFLSKTHRFAPYLAVAGLFFSMLHQSSLGATYGVLISRPIWYRPGLAVLFIISAGAGGIAMTMFATWVTGKLLPESNVKEELLEKVSRFLGWWLVGYMYLRFWDFFAMTYTHQPGRDEGLALLTKGPLAVNFWIGELLLGIFIPMIILLNNKLRKMPLARLLAWIMVIGGVIAYRWDTNLVGLLVVQTPFNMEDVLLYTSYSPAPIEIVISIGIISIGLLLFTLGAKYLRIVDHNPSTAEH
ncbi:MAG: polysulfide reductase NrfD [Anaerolineales bacterium]|jgi:Ni/Fe-hydrogenase subunit HybB-like protein